LQAAQLGFCCWNGFDSQKREFRFHRLAILLTFRETVDKVCVCGTNDNETRTGDTKMKLDCWMIDENINLTSVFLSSIDYTTPGFGVVDSRIAQNLESLGISETDAVAYATFATAEDGRLHGVSDSYLTQSQYDRLSLGEMSDPRPQMKRTYARTGY
jgi:hypothetical protein